MRDSIEIKRHLNSGDEGSEADLVNQNDIYSDDNLRRELKAQISKRDPLPESQIHPRNHEADCSLPLPH